jgi:nucleoside-triphosphatase
MSKKNILVTGRPRVGKTTLIKHCAHLLKNRAGGFYTEEIKGKGVRGRYGFCLKTLSGEEKILAEVGFNSSYHVGRYGVHLEVMEKFAVPELSDAMQNKEWIIIDEIGKMEEGSLLFKKTLIDILNGPKKVLATIRWNDDDFTRHIKNRNDVNVIKLTVPNRETIYDLLEKIIEKHK